jgi:hypothetical protein
MVLMGFQWVRPSVELHFWPDWHLLALLSRCLQYTVRIIASESQERRNPGNSRENTDGLFCLAAILFGINYTHSSEKELPQIWHAIIYISIIEAKNSRKFKTKIGNKE